MQSGALEEQWKLYTRRETVNLLLLLNTAEVFLSSGTEDSHSPPSPSPPVITAACRDESGRKIVPCVKQTMLSLHEGVIVFIDYLC